MPTKSIFSALCILLFVIVMAACGGKAAPTPTPGPGIETVVAWTFETMTAQAASGNLPAEAATSVPITDTIILTPISPVEPAEVLPLGTYGPYPADSCEVLRLNFEQALGVAVTAEAAPFEDPMGGAGISCMIHLTGNAVTLGVAGPSNSIISMLQTNGWTEDANYGAGGPQTMMDGFRKGSALGILTVRWDPSADANCPSNQPISACNLTPEQKLFDVKYEVSQIVVYQPIPAEQCSLWMGSVQPAVDVPMVQEIVTFVDISKDIGTACRLRGVATGAHFTNMGTPSQAIEAALLPEGWILVNGADGPTGVIRQYAKDNQVAVVSVMWKPSPDANCPSDQPISSCNLSPEQKLYTVTVDFAEK
jgi:hypothetical protein